MGSHTETQQHGPPAPALDDDQFFARHGHTRAPHLVQWLVTLRCPLSCPHCLAAGDDGVSEMSLDEAARLIEQVAQMGVRELLLTGGEPLARPDLPEIIALLAANGVRWSLNTAAMPGPAARRAIEAHPPGFVAVSLDGPAEVHDRFRGRDGALRDALHSLAYFSELGVEGGVAAGTTVTTENVDQLPATFGIVVESGATAWGLHLVVPEGRAASRPELFLSRDQLRRLLEFCAAKRNHFPVTMADEIGYCGGYEPLVRDEPFFCGAGKAQCVVLPDGEVVPCTTLDRSASAGNVRRRPLAEIWEHGFAELRHWRPEGPCASCVYAPACGGGCWLQRRHGRQCFRRAWSRRGVLSAAAKAVCLGLATAELPADAAPMEEPLRQKPDPALEAKATKIQALSGAIVNWYAAQVGGRRAPTIERTKQWLTRSLGDDPAARYVLDFIDGKRADDIAGRAKAIRAALKTEYRCLSLLGLAWRDVTEWCLDARPASERTAAERKTLRELVGTLSLTAGAWQRELYRLKLDPFVRRAASTRHFLASKAGPTTGQILQWNLGARRGFSPSRFSMRTRKWTPPKITDLFLLEHPHGESLRLAFRVTGGEGVVCRRMGKEVPFKGPLLPFDLLVVPERKEVAAPKLSIDWGEHAIAFALPTSVELTYADVLRVADEQNRERLDWCARMAGTSLRRPRGEREEPTPLALPALRRLRTKLQTGANVGRTPSDLRRVLWLLADIYLF